MVKRSEIAIMQKHLNDYIEFSCHSVCYRKVLCHLALIISHAGRNLPYVSYVIFKLGILELQGFHTIQ